MVNGIKFKLFGAQVRAFIFYIVYILALQVFTVLPIDIICLDVLCFM